MAWSRGMKAAIVLTANLLGWPVIQIGIAKLFLRMPSRNFSPTSFACRPRRWERDGRLYTHILRIRRWKQLMPDGAPWLGGFAKAHYEKRDDSYTRRFIAETCRGEMAHWCMLAFTPIFYLWNPPWACWVMTAYGLLANLPCIAVQRHNRIAMLRVLEKLTAAQ
ncbi:glycosyl-4,4'-diaponeurosporenoate acyltransferase CrtO family protein [Silvibacterium acidisoli]|uniref:glycosyl-4,4'-diaponeurosporenoate acyltransferase CrtO family protein n=1 Tax=Acidobacteriaceae bacterium ZG23-2 TaxID=2883246 RepID=UPI00406C2AFE